MSIGLYCVCENNMIIDTSTITGVLQDALQISTANSGSLSYPSLAGRTIFVQAVRNLSDIGSAYSNRGLQFNINYSLGYPEITYVPVGSGNNYMMTVYVLVK